MSTLPKFNSEFFPEQLPGPNRKDRFPTAIFQGPKLLNFGGVTLDDCECEFPSGEGLILSSMSPMSSGGWSVAEGTSKQPGQVGHVLPITAVIIVLQVHSGLEG